MLLGTSALFMTISIGAQSVHTANSKENSRVHIKDELSALFPPLNNMRAVALCCNNCTTKIHSPLGKGWEFDYDISVNKMSVADSTSATELSSGVHMPTKFELVSAFKNVRGSGYLRYWITKSRQQVYKIDISLRAHARPSVKVSQNISDKSLSEIKLNVNETSVCASGDSSVAYALNKLASILSIRSNWRGSDINVQAPSSAVTGGYLDVRLYCPDVLQNGESDPPQANSGASILFNSMALSGHLRKQFLVDVNYTYNDRPVYKIKAETKIVQ